MKKNEHAYTISEIDTMIGLYENQMVLLCEHLAITSHNNVIVNFIANNKKRIPSMARLDIVSCAKEMERTTQDLYDRLSQKIETLKNLKYDMLDEIKETYGDNYSEDESTDVLDDLNEAFEDYFCVEKE